MPLISSVGQGTPQRRVTTSAKNDIVPDAAYRTLIDLAVIVSADSARYHMRRFGLG